ncbi:MAG: hypothetical protein U5L96_03750 [Owenweeksia sp.]|nr:hypothetical protein [Owenweeksia sp.]
MILFILQFIIYSGLLYLAYRLLFSQMSFFKLNRGILLAIPAISILIPLVAPQFEAPRITQPAISAVLQEVNLSGNVIATQAQHAGSPNFSWWWLAYGFGAATVLAYVLIGFVKGLNILRHSTHAFENIHFSEFDQRSLCLF